MGGARRTAVTVLLAGACAVWGTWPVSRHLADHVYEPPLGSTVLGTLRDDVLLTIWILAWDLHALATRPAELFAANIFHPFGSALALSEGMLGALPLYAPAAWLTGSAIAAHQTTLVATFGLAFLTASAAVRAWTGSASAGLVAGALFAFGPARVAHLGSLQMEGSWWLPLVLLAAERALATGALRWAALLVVSLVGQTLWSYYLGYAAFLAAGTFAAAMLAFDRGVRRNAWRVALALGTAAAVVGVASLPYLRLRGAGILEPPALALLRAGSARLGHTGAAPALVVALLTAPLVRDGGPRVRALWAAAVVAHLLALGPVVALAGLELPGPFALLADLVPGVAVIRVPQRLNVAAGAALSLLAGVGIAAALARLAMRRETALHLTAAAAAAVAVVALGSRRAIELRALPAPGAMPAVHRWLRARPPAPLLELPFHDVELEPTAREPEARRMYFSTEHWHRLLNGYSGHVPPTYRVVSALVRALPDERSGRILAATTGLRRIVLHRRELSRAERRRWRRRAARAWLRPVAKHGTDVVFVPRAAATAAAAHRLADAPADRTILGTPLEPVPAVERRAALALLEPIPEVLVPGIAFDVPVRVENRSGRRWPALAAEARHVVGLVYRWEDGAGRVLRSADRPQRLPDDLAAGGSMSALVSVVAPRGRAAAVLVVGVAQDGAWFEGPAPRVPATIAPLVPAHVESRRPAR